MTNMTGREEWGIAIGDAYWRLFQIKERASGFYLIPPTKIGLHLSFHPPNLNYPDFHAHIRDAKLGIHEDIKIDDRVFSKDYWMSLLPTIIDTLERGLNPDLNDEEVMVLPPDTFGGLLRKSNTSRRVFNVGGFFNGEFYIGEARRLPSLLQKMQGIYGHQIFGSMGGFTSSGRLFIPIDSKTVYEMRFPEMLQLFKMEELGNALFDSMSRTMKTLEQHASINDIFNLAFLVDFVEKLQKQTQISKIQIVYF